jgi:hypothetical protein
MRDHPQGIGHSIPAGREANTSPLRTGLKRSRRSPSPSNVSGLRPPITGISKSIHRTHSTPKLIRALDTEQGTSLSSRSKWGPYRAATVCRPRLLKPNVPFCMQSYDFISAYQSWNNLRDSLWYLLVSTDTFQEIPTLPLSARHIHPLHAVSRGYPVHLWVSVLHP